jgi:hypothetical protein
MRASELERELTVERRSRSLADGEKERRGTPMVSRDVRRDSGAWSGGIGSSLNMNSMLTGESERDVVLPFIDSSDLRRDVIGRECCGVRGPSS